MSEKFCKYLFVIILVIGIGLRFAEYISNRSLTIDEAITAYRINSVPLQDLSFPQNSSTKEMAGYPVGFFFVEKCIARLLTHNEFALRLFPFICGILSLFVFAIVSKKILGIRWALLALGLFAISRDLVFYSSELKPYSSDVCLSVILLWYFCRLNEHPLTIKDGVKLGLFGAVCVFFSFSAFFVFISMAMGLVIYNLGKGQRQKAKVLALAGLMMALSFFLYYFYSLQYFRSDQDLASFWEVNFIPFHDGPVAVFQWLVVTFKRVFTRTLQIPGAFGGIAFLLGSFALWKKSKEVFIIVFTPILFTLMLSALKIYPFDGRVIAFLLPFFIILIVQGIVFVGRRQSSRFQRITYVILIVCVLFYPVQFSARQFMEPFGAEEMKPTLSYIAKHWQKGDFIMLHRGSIPAFHYYRERYGLKKDPFILGSYDEGKVPLKSSSYETLMAHKRVWVVFTHVPHFKEMSERRHILKILDNGWKRLDDFFIKLSKNSVPASLDDNISASVHLYELN